MKRNCMLFLLIIAFITCSAGTLWALPITNTSDDGFEDYPDDDGTRFAWYQNTGEFMFVADGNNEGGNLLLVQGLVIDWLNVEYKEYNTTGFTLVNTTSTVTSIGVDYDGKNVDEFDTSASGTFQVNNPIYPGGIEFYGVKAGNYFAMYYEAGGETYGSWSTFDLWKEKGIGSSLEVSHFTGYSGAAAPVPEPATMLLFGCGLIGLTVVGRKKLRITQR